MTQKTDELLARSLTAETTELIPFLPYLLQDFWALGSSPRDIAGLIKKHMLLDKQTKILDLACGKGAVSIHIAQNLGVNVYGFDLTSEFIDYSKEKAKELNVAELCNFTVADANNVVNTERGYDCVIFGAAGNILGNPEETLRKLIQTIKPGGYIIIDEAYLSDDVNNSEVKYKNYEYLSHNEWRSLFESNGLFLVEELQSNGDYDFDTDNNNIAKRALELISKYPEKKSIFEGYVKSQLAECEDLTDNLVAITWMLQKTTGHNK